MTPNKCSGPFGRAYKLAESGHHSVAFACVIRALSYRATRPLDAAFYAGVRSAVGPALARDRPVPLVRERRVPRASKE
jgi:hypothetical protein